VKRKDLVIIVLVIVFSAIVSTVVSKAVFGPSKRNLKYEVVEKISADFPEQGSQDYTKQYGPIFNSQAIDPTKLIQIGDSTNPKPF
jgi:hypothetical protein